MSRLTNIFSTRTRLCGALSKDGIFSRGIHKITKLDNVCYNNNLLVSFLPLWVPSVNVCLLETGPEACSERETDTPSSHRYHLAFLLLGIIVSVTGFFILFLRAQAVFAYNHQSPPQDGSPGGLLSHLLIR